ncbi:MAG: hypothetical protein ABMA13_20150 [Chthoniobacteraceae bacterium]
MKLTPDDVARLEARQLANIIRKISAGKTPTAREAALLAQAKVGGAGDAASAFAPTWDELAQRLGTTRRSLQEWRKDPRYAPDCPKPQADGRLDVAAFAGWMILHGLKRAADHVSGHGGAEPEDGQPPVIHPPLIGGSKADWDKFEKKLITDKRQAQLDTLCGTLLVAADLEVPLGATLAAVHIKMAMFAPRVARFIAGLRDVAEIEDRLRDEIDADLRDLHAARYVEIVPAEVVAGIAGLDDAQRAQLTTLLEECLRRIGRRVIEGSAPPGVVADTAPPSPVTLSEAQGPVTSRRKSRRFPGSARDEKKKRARKK